MKVSIGNDHAGTQYKLKIVEYLEKKKLQNQKSWDKQ
jgi:ribose 5-phosphate isomerase RpiB